MNKRTAFGLEVEYEETAFEKACWGSQHTREQTINLIDRTCAIKFDCRNGDTKSALGPRSSQPNNADYCSRIHAIIRQYLINDYGIVCSRIDSICNEGTQDKQFRLRMMKRPTALHQLRRLQRTIPLKSAYKFEKAYFSLSSEAWDHLAIGFQEAGRNGKLREFSKIDDLAGYLLLRPILNVDLLELILPYAIAAAPKNGRPSVKSRDRALADLFQIFMELTGRPNPAARLGGFDEPCGAGADFIRSLENIFDVKLMPCSSTHAVNRACQLLKK